MDSSRLFQMMLAFLAVNMTALGAAPPPGDLLAGPAVDSAAMQPLTAKPLGNGFQKSSGRNATIPRALWLDALKGVSLSDEQRKQIAAIVREFRNRPRQPGAQSLAPAPSWVQPSRTQRPRPMELQRLIWNELNPEQREMFKENLKRIRVRLAVPHEARAVVEEPIDTMTPRPNGNSALSAKDAETSPPSSNQEAGNDRRAGAKAWQARPRGCKASPRKYRSMRPAPASGRHTP